ncbi:hypothetical protein [Nocardiopsis protaetiae]|uniref:hypothetical protein n=1 Tax=Nocardiopsis protaetiae TaxID=3382270 RepID=UPI00387B1F10
MIDRLIVDITRGDVVASGGPDDALVHAGPCQEMPHPVRGGVTGVLDKAPAVLAVRAGRG